MQTYQNKRLAVKALAALRAGRYYDHSDREEDSPQDGIANLLTDLRHLCDSLGIDFAELDCNAYSQYVAELDRQLGPCQHDLDRFGKCCNCKLWIYDNLVD
jgi:hypothetical protein